MRRGSTVHMGLDYLSFFLILLGFSVSRVANQPTVHSGGVIRERVCSCGCWRWGQVTGDRGQVTGDR